MEKRRALESARLYLIVTPAACVHGLAETVLRAIEGGVELVQLRDKQADDETFLARAELVGEACRGAGVPFVINDRVHLLERSGADGVHVGEDDASPEAIRREHGERFLVGWSAHDGAEVVAAAERPVDYVGLGPMYATDTKALTREPGGPDLVRDVAAAARLPWFPVGGITAHSLPQLVEAGATRAAVSGAICRAQDPGAAARELRLILDRA